MFIIMGLIGIQSENINFLQFLKGVEKLVYYFAPVYILLFLSTLRFNLKYWKIVRQIKRQEIEIEDEMDSKFVEEMINNNLKFYRKIKLKKLDKV